ncbi:MAG: zf-TFIIB domain-containing protein [Bacteroidota bacterium]
MKLVACPQCHAQYDAAQAQGPTIHCRCGAAFPAEPPRAKDVAVTRCAACGALVGDNERVCSYCGAAVIRRPAPSGPVCPECYAQNPESARFCVACGLAFLPQPIRTRTSSLQCPVCADATLASRNLGGIWVDECPSCLGLWTPGDVMDRLIDRIRVRLQAQGATAPDAAHHERRSKWQPEFTYRKCPECGVMMQRRNFGRRSGVVVDWCASHGTWLDAHELEDIADFVIQGGLRVTDGEDWALTADPKRVAAVAAAESILGEERLHDSRQRPVTLSDVLLQLLQRRV